MSVSKLSPIGKTSDKCSPVPTGNANNFETRKKRGKGRRIKGT